MVRIWGSAGIAGSILGVLEIVAGSSASAFDRRIELTNNTRMAIVEIQIAKVGTGRWEGDLLGDDILLPAQSVLVDIDDAKGYLARLQKAVPGSGRVADLENAIRAGQVSPSELSEARRLICQGLVRIDADPCVRARRAASSVRCPSKRHPTLVPRIQ